MKIVNPKSGEVIATAVHNLIEFTVGGTRIVIAGSDYGVTIKYPEVDEKCLVTVENGKMVIEQPEYLVENKEVQNEQKKDNSNESNEEPTGGSPAGEPATNPNNDSGGTPPADTKSGGGEPTGGDGGQESDSDRDDGEKGNSSERKYTKVQ